MAKTGAEVDAPDLLPIYERVSVQRNGQWFTAGVQLDTDIGAEIEKLGSALFRNTFGSSMGSTGTSLGPAEEQLDESPVRFTNAGVASLQPYDAFGDSFMKPQWQEGPFAMSVSRVHADDSGGLVVDPEDGRPGAAQSG